MHVIELKLYCNSDRGACKHKGPQCFTCPFLGVSRVPHTGHGCKHEKSDSPLLT